MNAAKEQRVQPIPSGLPAMVRTNTAEARSEAGPTHQRRVARLPTWVLTAGVRLPLEMRGSIPRTRHLFSNARAAATNSAASRSSNRINQTRTSCAAFALSRVTSLLGQDMIANIAAEQMKPRDITANEMFGHQRDIGGVAGLREPHHMTREVVCRQSFGNALVACLLHCGESDMEIAKKINVSKGYMSKLLRGLLEVHLKRLVAFMRATNCIAPLQWQAHQMGCEVVIRASAEARVAELEAQIADVKRGRAA